MTPGARALMLTWETVRGMGPAPAFGASALIVTWATGNCGLTTTAGAGAAMVTWATVRFTLVPPAAPLNVATQAVKKLEA